VSYQHFFGGVDMLRDPTRLNSNFYFVILFDWRST